MGPMRSWAREQFLGRRWDRGEHGPGDDLVRGEGFGMVGRQEKNIICGSQGEARF
jgi:hypothetical protein